MFGWLKNRPLLVALLAMMIALVPLAFVTGDYIPFVFSAALIGFTIMCVILFEAVDRWAHAGTCSWCGHNEHPYVQCTERLCPCRALG